MRGWLPAGVLASAMLWGSALAQDSHPQLNLSNTKERRAECTKEKALDIAKRAKKFVAFCYPTHGDKGGCKFSISGLASSAGPSDVIWVVTALRTFDKTGHPMNGDGMTTMTARIPDDTSVLGHVFVAHYEPN